MKSKQEEILQLRRELRQRDETIQQREIDLSCLRGQVKQALEDIDDDDSDTLTYVDEDQDEDQEQILINDLSDSD